MSDTLRVGGLTPLTSVDYPGELAAVVYCQGCPWRCPYCHNRHLVDETGAVPAQLDWAEVLRRLESRRGLLDAVVFSGGEPTAQAALAAAMAEVRALGFKVGLHTGGPYPERLQRLLPHLDWVGLDIKALPEDYAQVTGAAGSGERAWQSLRLLLDAGVDLEVRTTPMPGLDDDAYLQRLMQQLADAGVRNYVLQQCQPVHLRDPSLKGRLRALPEHWPSAPIEHVALRAA
ncbi:anaerobic ribonucleoside-triphosphate reductase activating protein [Halochromatium glycolicum]|uniref:Anaerobic ribonucleoside-triphosphate reductase activating protein n=1 Tax=Halochromatium glycolicum TaxID=85075 RepID=A0AAJ0X8G8_9GAMM|nr:anaerobic ribonucleoside-triphosphate reductase activating protein [Halochromatium glycolicum]MBK1703053.1 anaerobic ribonucleoside-triphosphate reductase activating protein [Halochromatium glycolicum]